VDLLDMTFLVLSVLLGSLAYMPLPRPVPVPTVPAVRSLRPAPAASRAAAGSVSMCGILAIVNSRKSADALRLQTLTLQRLVRHRGPDGSGIHVVEKHDEKGPLCSSLAHERLAIVDPLSGNQPLYSHDRKRSLAVNGEIYNHKALRKTLKDQTPFRTESDCEVIVHLYDEIGVDVASKLDGDFARPHRRQLALHGHRTRWLEVVRLGGQAARGGGLHRRLDVPAGSLLHERRRRQDGRVLQA
jgi:hypothetical protein